ncbi:MAG TPA: right-handed parallel beta-helix repeat-containing protein [Nitrososphaeraceae archaeon]|nr:right-handed parallel beta-helix repeat-containing protein [Nitrososphaeraceae archaeon]
MQRINFGKFTRCLAPVFLVSFLFSSIYQISLYSYALEIRTGDTERENNCVEYDSAENLIHIFCESIRLSGIAKQINNESILRSEETAHNIDYKNRTDTTPEEVAKTWHLNAGLSIEKGATLIIDSFDTFWLKISSTPTIQNESSELTTNEYESNLTNSPEKIVSQREQTSLTGDKLLEVKKSDKPVITVSKNNKDNPNGIHVHGSLVIDSVKITSWDPEINDVIKFRFGKRPGEVNTKSDYDTVEPRAFIRISRDATATTNITNSEIAYLGYSCSKCSGISYYGGIGSIVRGNDIHHLLKGYYSNGMGNTVIENNLFHDNYLYGIDPHTGSHDMIIRNNTVYNNNASGIICSKQCYNILIEKNDVYKNKGPGIMFSIDMQNSTAKNNYVHDMGSCISSNKGSSYNLISNNTMFNCKKAIDLSNTFDNIISNNNISKSDIGILISNSSDKIYNNDITDTRENTVVRNQTNIIS